MQRALALGLALAATAAFPAAAREPLSVYNRTGLPAIELYAVRSPRGSANDWGRNLLSRPLGMDGGFSLRPADDAVAVDTTGLTIDEVFARIVDLARAVR